MAENMPKFRQIDLGAEVKKILGKEWNAPSLEYEFSNGRKFYRKDEQFGCYEGSPNFLDGR
jgi:hypothetical protein